MSLPFAVPGPAYRTEQVRHWVYRRFVERFEEMTDLPASLRAELGGTTRPLPATVQTSQDGRTSKALWPDLYEAVAMTNGARHTVCVSSQSGCGFGCTFCATGQMGLKRNLSAFEIVSQVLWAGRLWGVTPTGVVFMGMGEPLANLPAVKGAIASLKADVGMSSHRITVSTVGVVSKIAELAETNVRLALSLHAPDDETRSKLVPLNDRWNVAACLQAARDYQHATGRRASIEYALIGGVNDHAWQADRLGRLLRPTGMHVNVIPLNPTAGYPGHRSKRVDAFADEVRAHGVNVTVRLTQGRDIDAACGQLAAKSLQLVQPSTSVSDVTSEAEQERPGIIRP